MAGRTPQRPGLHRSHGYTLIELVSVVSVMSIIGLVASYTIFESMKIYARTAPMLDATYQARLSVERMKREIRDMQDTASITNFTSTGLTFNDSSNNTIAFSLSSGNLLRNGDMLARGVTTLGFDYWAADGAVAASAAELHLIEIDLTVETATQPYRIRTAVFPRVLTP